MPNKCEKSHVMIKDGCKLVRRRVYNTTSEKQYIHLGGKEVHLSALKGKFRYTD
jgi:hypothetical protein